jgi:hypothetical protein
LYHLPPPSRSRFSRPAENNNYNNNNNNNQKKTKQMAEKSRFPNRPQKDELES